MKKNQILNVLPKEVRAMIEQKNLQYDYLQEIKMRVGKPLILIYKGKEILEEKAGKTPYITEKELKETLDYITNYSLYAFEQEMKQGFITIEGGHRVGISGQVVLEAGQVKNIKYISSINIRVSHEVMGCADPIFFNIIKDKIY